MDDNDITEQITVHQETEVDSEDLPYVDFGFEFTSEDD